VWTAVDGALIIKSLVSMSHVADIALGRPVTLAIPPDAVTVLAE
jgi:hypothetical protein